MRGWIEEGRASREERRGEEREHAFDGGGSCRVRLWAELRAVDPRADEGVGGRRPLPRGMPRRGPHRYEARDRREEPRDERRRAEMS